MLFASFYKGLPTRGHTDDNSNYHQLLPTRSSDVENKEAWLEKKNNWTSHAIQNEMLSMMATTVLQQKVQEIRANYGK